MKHRCLAVVAGVVAVVVLVASGCASTQRKRAQFMFWSGHYISEAIRDFGPPTRTMPFADGTTYVWESTPDIGLGDPKQTYVRRVFLVSRDGKILGWGMRQSVFDPRWVHAEEGQRR
jgi:hypothetical protein